MTENKSRLYQSPLCVEIEFIHEGILCSSTLGTGSNHEGIVGDDDDIFNF